MKSIRIASLALCSSAFLLSANAEKVRFEQLPIDLRDKIRVHSGSAPIEDVDRQTKDGKTVYEVAFKKNGQHTELMFDDKGVPITADGKPALDSRKITYAELPEAVRKSLETRVKQNEVNDIDRQVKNGQATYEVGFKQNNRQQEIILSQEGRVLGDSLDVPDSGNPSATASASTSSQSTLASQPVTLSSTQKIQLTQAPALVQRAIRTASAGARIEDLDRGTWQGQNVYEAAFKENGKHVEVQVRENGTILHDPRAVGGAASASSGRGGSAARPAEYATVTSLVPLSSGAKVERSALPGAVQRRLNTHIATSNIEDIERGTWQGKTIYQVAFKDENNKHVELQMDENGNIVFDPRLK
jgi:uncharacterized membrane protein YkoI